MPTARTGGTSDSGNLLSSAHFSRRGGPSSGVTTELTAAFAQATLLRSLSPQLQQIAEVLSIALNSF